MLFTHIYADDRGESHFSDVEMPLTPIAPAVGLPPMQLSPCIDSAHMQFLAGAPSLIAHDWHLAPARQFVLFLKGALEVEVSDGEKRRFGQGSIVFLEDTSGKGHKDHVVNDEELLFALVLVPNEVTVQKLAEVS